MYKYLLIFFFFYFTSFCSKTDSKLDSVNVGDSEVDLKGHRLGIQTMDYEAALKYAKKNKKMVLLNFTGSDWCGYCIKMNKRIFKTKEWKEFAKKNLAIVFLDFPRSIKNKKNISEEQSKLNKKLFNKYSIRGFPTFILLDYNGNFTQKLGYAEKVSDFVNNIKVPYFLNELFIDTVKNLTKKDKEKYNKLRKDYNKANLVLSEWLNTNPKKSKENTKKYQKFNEEINIALDDLLKFCESLN